MNVADMIAALSLLPPELEIEMVHEVYNGTDQMRFDEPILIVTEQLDTVYITIPIYRDLIEHRFLIDTYSIDELVENEVENGL